jgi:choline dehydrogenase
MTLVFRLLSAAIACQTHFAMAFDYVIAGGGTAGLVIANRLSEDPSITVAVVEPGSDVRNDPGVLNLDLAGASYNPDFDWKFNSTAQPQLGDRVITHPAGKALGGTTAINGLYYIRGNKADYDAWEQLGNPGWNWDTLFPYFKRSEKFAIPTNAQHEAGMTYASCVHGKDGPLNTGHAYGVSNSSFHESAQETCSKLGFDLNQDMNGGETRGFGAYPKTLDREANVRESAARAYYEPIDSRPNLQIIRGTVTQILFGERAADKLIATGVEYTNEEGHPTSISAKKEVVISAGAYISPVLLEASGIGNPNILARSGVEPKVDLPSVGEGLQDQPLWVLMFQAKEEITGQVPFAAFASAQDIFGANTNTIAASTKDELALWSDIISKRLNGGISASALLERFKVQHDVFYDEKATIAEFEFFSLGSIVGMVFQPTLPFSWGSVHLNAAGETQNPVVDPNFLSIDFDKKVAREVGRMARSMWSTPPLSDTVSSLIMPGDAVLPVNATDEQWDKFLINTCAPASHSIGTCAMLPRDLGGVVDPTFKVYGTANVRVADASVIPQLISGHTSAAVYALAERAADLIKASFLSPA